MDQYDIVIKARWSWLPITHFDCETVYIDLLPPNPKSNIQKMKRMNVERYENFRPPGLSQTKMLPETVSEQAESPVFDFKNAREILK